MVGGNRWRVEDSPMGQELVQCLIGLAQVSISLKDFNTANQAYKQALEVAVASSCPEYMLCEIRDAYLQILQQTGHTAEAKKLIADEDYSRCSAEGNAAMYKGDYQEA